MYSLLQRFFQNIFHSGQPALNGAADAAPSNALGCRDLGLAHAEKIVLVHTPGLRGRELGQRVIEGNGGFPRFNVLIRGHGLAEHVGLKAGIGVQRALAISALLPLVAVAQAASHREGGGDLVRNFQHHIFGHIGVIPFQVDSRHDCPPFQKVVGECGLKWRIGGPRHLGASGHRDQKQGHIKTPAQHDTMRAHEILLLFLYLFISRPYPDFSNGGATLFLADADYERYEKAKWTRRYLLGHRRILKKGRLYHTPRKSNFSKGKRRLEM